MEPEADRGHRDGAVEDAGPLVVAGREGAKALQAVDRPLDLVATLVLLLVEAGGESASAATAPTVGPLALRFGNGVLDMASAQVAAVPTGGARLMGSEVGGSRPCDGVPPGGVADQGAGIRRSGMATPPERRFNSPQQGASWTAASAEIARGLVPERVTLDPLHHGAGRDRPCLRPAPARPVSAPRAQQ